MFKNLYLVFDLENKKVLEITFYKWVAYYFKICHSIWLKQVVVVPVDRKLFGQSLFDAFVKNPLE